MNATTTPAKHLIVYPTTDQLTYQDMWVAGGAFGTLLDWARENGLALIEDFDSDETVTGYYVVDLEGRQVAAATLTNR